MKLVIPMAGRGSRFADQGIDTPKPLIEVAGKPMLDHALAGLSDLAFSGVIFVALREHDAASNLTARLKARFGDRCEVVLLDNVTEGQLCTVLAARELLDPDEDVLVGGCDTLVHGGLAEVLRNRDERLRGVLSVAQLPGDRWSFARADASGDVVEVAEKRRISDWCCTGLYWFASAAEFLALADAMIAANDRTRGEFFVTPLYGWYLQRGLQVQIAPCDVIADMGTPDAAAEFERRHAEGELPELPGLRFAAPTGVR